MRYWPEPHVKARWMQLSALEGLLEERNEEKALQVMRAFITKYPQVDVSVRENVSPILRGGKGIEKPLKVSHETRVMCWDMSRVGRTQILSHKTLARELLRLNVCVPGLEAMQDFIRPIQMDTEFTWDAWAQGLALADPNLRRFLGWAVNRRIITWLPMRHLKLPKVDLSQADLSGADLSESVLDEANMEEVFALHLRMTSISSQAANWRGCDLVSPVGVGGRFGSCDFVYSQISKGCFAGGHFDASDFTEARVNDTNFVRSSFRKARFLRTKLLKCDFTGADLRGAEFEGADLKGCYFLGADLAGASFVDCFNVDEAHFQYK